jgi:hypothetical protein
MAEAQEVLGFSGMHRVLQRLADPIGVLEEGGWNES